MTTPDGSMPIVRIKTEQDLVPYVQSLELAKKMFEKHKIEIIEAEIDGHRSIGKAITKIPDELKQRFFAHGITRNNETEQLAAFLNILENNTIKGDYGNLEGGQFGAWTRGEFLILSHIDTPLATKLEDGFNIVRNNMGWVANIGAYVIGAKYYPILDELREMYPKRKIIKADEVLEYVKEAERQQGV